MPTINVVYIRGRLEIAPTQQLYIFGGSVVFNKKIMALRDALYNLKPLFRGFSEYKNKHPEEAILLLSRHGYNFDDDEKWTYAEDKNYPTEVFVKDIYDFCVKNGKAETNGVVFTNEHGTTRISASDVNTLIENYVCAFNDILESDNMIISFASDRSSAFITTA